MLCTDFTAHLMNYTDSGHVMNQADTSTCDLLYAYIFASDHTLHRGLLDTDGLEHRWM